MGRPAELTKQQLLDLGVTEVTKEGDVYMGDILLKPVIATKSSRFKKQQYKIINIYDRALYLKQKERYQKYIPGKVLGMHGFVLSRVIYAWFYGVCPGNMDCDHIDNNSLNNNLDNLQLLTRQENLAKRKGYRNQYLASYRGD